MAALCCLTSVIKGNWFKAGSITMIWLLALQKCDHFYAFFMKYRYFTNIIFQIYIPLPPKIDPSVLGDGNKLFVFKSLLTTPSNVLPLHLKQTFPPTIWIFTEVEGDGIESRLPFEIFFTLTHSSCREVGSLGNILSNFARVSYF